MPLMDQRQSSLFEASQFDLILMDIEMPGMNGFEATTRILRLRRRSTLGMDTDHFVTATDTATMSLRPSEAGGDDFISKIAPEGVLQAKMKAMSRIATMRAD